MLKHKIDLIVGDWSRDGHEKSEVVKIKSNLTLEELQAAYKDGSKLIGVDLIKNVCKDYEDNKIPKEICEKILKSLAALNLKSSLEWFEEDLEEDVWIYESEWAYVILDVCRIGCPNFEWEEVEDGENWKIGGYGVFS